MAKPVCMKCKLFFRPKKNGTYFTEAMPRGSNEATRSWVPYKIWAGDLWECRGCGTEIIISGLHEMAIQHEESFKTLQKSTGAGDIQINDC